MISSDGYSIEQHTKKNRIVIYLPQTAETMTNTMIPMKERKLRLSDTELATLLHVARTMYEAEQTEPNLSDIPTTTEDCSTDADCPWK